MTIFFTFLQYSKKGLFTKNNHISNEGKERRMLKWPALKSSGLYISAFKDGPNREALNMFENMFEKDSIIWWFSFNVTTRSLGIFKYFLQTSGLYWKNLFYAPNITKLVFLISDRYSHHWSDNAYAHACSLGCWNCMVMQFYILNVFVREMCALYTIQNFITDKFRSEDIRAGPFSIRPKKAILNSQN